MTTNRQYEILDDLADATHVRRNPVPAPPGPPLRPVQKIDFTTREKGVDWPVIETEDGALWGYGHLDTWEFASVVNKFLAETADVYATFQRVDVDRAWAASDGVDEFGEFEFKVARGAGFIPGGVGSTKRVFPVVVIRP